MSTTERADAGTQARIAAQAQAAANPDTDPARRGFSTNSIHAGYHPDGQTGAINVPIYASTTFAQDAVASLRGGYEYTRVGNPTVAACEQAVAALEGGQFGRAFASGMAATDTVLRVLLHPGEHLIMGTDAYGGTFRLIDTFFKDWGVEYTVVDTTDPAQVAAAVRPTTRVVWLETPTNPLLSITDIPSVSAAVRAAAAGQQAPTIVVDNTFATPYLQRPLELGADVVVHSCTKYLGGHSDVVGGMVVSSDADFDAQVLFLQGGVGAVSSPFDAYLTYRGIKTLAVRMDRHCANAAAVARELAASPAVSQVFYPGLEDHPGHEVARAQMRDFGGMVSVRFAGGPAAARTFCESTRLFLPG